MIGTDACAVPVLTSQEAAKRSSHIPMPHPQLSSQANMVKSSSDSKELITIPGTHTKEVLRAYGITDARAQWLEEEGVFGKSSWHSSKL